MAIGEYQDAGQVVDFKFYDSYNSPDSLETIKLLLDSVVRPDLILGPMYTLGYCNLREIFSKIMW